jgi:hypothetical protein
VKLKTQGLAPKVPVQAVTSLIVAALAYYGVDLDAEVSAALGVVLGFAAGIVAPAAPVAKVRVSRKAEAGYGVVELLIAAILLLVFIWLVFAIAH